MMVAALQVCLHTGTFVYHYKGSTIPPTIGPNDTRESWVRADQLSTVPSSEERQDADAGSASSEGRDTVAGGPQKLHRRLR
jgi:hypothetical protein